MNSGSRHHLLTRLIVDVDERSASDRGRSHRYTRVADVGIDVLSLWIEARGVGCLCGHEEKMLCDEV